MKAVNSKPKCQFETLLAQMAALLLVFFHLGAWGQTQITSTYSINGKNGVVIDNYSFSSSSGHCLTIMDSQNITIRNSRFVNCGDHGIRIDNSSNIRIENSYFERTKNHAILAVNSNSIVVNANKFKNAISGTFPMFIGVGGSSRITNNVGVNEPGASSPEDVVAINENKSPASDPLIIENNCFKGGGPSTSGGGIMVGQIGGSNIIVRNNTLVDVGQYGIGVAGGQNIQVLSNKVSARRQSFTNVGIYVWGQYNASCSNHTVSGNRVNWLNSSGSQNPKWDGGNCGSISGWNNNSWGDTTLTGLDCSLDSIPSPGPVTSPSPSSAPTITSPPSASNITSSSATITWSLNVPATGQVEYGPTTGYGSFSTLESSFNWSTHIQTLRNLSAGTTYHYRIISKSQAGGTVVSGDRTFVTSGGSSPAPQPAPAPVPVPNAPVITSQPSVSNLTTSSATVTWSLNVVATGQIEYGPTTGYGSFSTLESSFNWSTHIQTLRNLSAGTTYHYRIISKSQAGGQVVSGDKTFTTAGTVSSPQPVPQPAPQPSANYALSISSPASGATVSGSIQVNGTGPGFLNVEIFSPDGALLARTVPNSIGSFSATVDTTKLYNGSQTLNIYAWDSPAGQAFNHTQQKQLSLNVQNAGGDAPPAKGTTPLLGPGGYTRMVMNDSFGSSKSGANFTSLSQFNQGTYGRNGAGWDDYMCAWDCGKANLSMASDHLEIRPTGGKSGFISSRFEWLPSGSEHVYYEIRAATGRGATAPQTWPAFWLFAGNEAGSNNAQSEFDIMETYMNQWDSSGNSSSGYSNHFATVIHENANESHEFKIIETPGIDVTTTFHVYGCEVYKGSNGNLQFNIYFDGKFVYSTSQGLNWRSSPPSLFIGWNPGSTSWSPAVMKLDYVKAWVK